MLRKLTRWFTPARQRHAEPAFHAVHLDFAYACMTCKFIIDGAHQGHCKRCGSGQIFRVRSVLDRVVSPLRERLQEQDQQRARRSQAPQTNRPLTDNLAATFTEFRTPKDAA